MKANRKILMLAGDGIGPEVMNEVKNIISWMQSYRGIEFNIQEGLVGGVAYDRHGTSLTDLTMEDALSSDAVLFGSVGGPKWDNVKREHRPEAGLLRLRKEMDLYANLRPASVFDALIQASTLKEEIISGLNLMIVRELTAGVYFGTPRGTEELEDGTRRAFDTETYTETEIIRVARVAFELSKKRSNRLHSVEKANVMESGLFWRDVVSKLHQTDYPDVELQHMYADNCAMQLVRNPKQFDVIVTSNLFGDILSDCAAMLTGSLGMLPSASLGDVNDFGQRKALYEPVHGSAPDIAGKQIANPIAMIMSFAMMLRYSFDLVAEAALVEQSVKNALSHGFRTTDIMQDNKTEISTADMGAAIIEEISKLNQN